MRPKALVARHFAVQSLLRPTHEFDSKIELLSDIRMIVNYISIQLQKFAAWDVS
jgi:hypothetical protein